MASLDGIEPKYHGDDKYLGCGWHRVLTGPSTLKYIGPKKTPQIEQMVYNAETGMEAKAQHWVSEKCLASYVSWVECCGLDRDQRREIDTENVETLRPLEDRNLWVMIDYRQNDQSGKWYKEIVRWRADSDDQPQGQPKHMENPSFAAGARPPARSTGTTSAAYSPSVDEEDIPF
jgi:hypothetical protein